MKVKELVKWEQDELKELLAKEIRKDEIELLGWETIAKVLKEHNNYLDKKPTKRIEKDFAQEIDGNEYGLKLSFNWDNSFSWEKKAEIRLHCNDSKYGHLSFMPVEIYQEYYKCNGDVVIDNMSIWSDRLNVWIENRKKTLENYKSNLDNFDQAMDEYNELATKCKEYGNKYLFLHNKFYC